MRENIAVKEVVKVAKIKKQRKAPQINQPVATIGYKHKPLGVWPNGNKHTAVKSPEEKDEESAVGSMPESGSDEVSDVEDIAKSMGIYDETNPNSNDTESGPENPAEVDIAKEIEKNKDG